MPNKVMDRRKRKMMIRRKKQIPYRSFVSGLKKRIDKGLKTNAKDIPEGILSPKSFSAKQIKKIRKECNLSQTWFAYVLNVSPKTIQAWEQGKNKPDGSSLVLLHICKNNPDKICELFLS